MAEKQSAAIALGETCPDCGNVRGMANPLRFACSDCWDALPRDVYPGDAAANLVIVSPDGTGHWGDAGKTGCGIRRDRRRMVVAALTRAYDAAWVALRMWHLTRDYDFSPYQMYADDALFKLGLARHKVTAGEDRDAAYAPYTSLM